MTRRNRVYLVKYRCVFVRTEEDWHSQTNKGYCLASKDDWNNAKIIVCCPYSCVGDGKI